VKRIIAVILCALQFIPSAVAAADFDPSFIISDAEATETLSYDASGIAAFLRAQGGGLGNLSFTDVDGVTKPAAEIIYNAAIKNSVSPRFLLALLQREQSLITDPNPSETQLNWATGLGVCDACSMSDPALQKYLGFAKQVDGAAANFRYFMDNGNRLSGFRRAGVATTIDGLAFTPKNAATANLYNYTPHLNGQKNFWFTWQKYFVRRQPSGSLVTAEPEFPGVWLIKYGERRKISSITVLVSRFGEKNIRKIPANDLLAYSEGREIKFSDYSLLRAPTGTVFLLVGDERRGIESQEVFRRLGFDKSEIIDVAWDDLSSYKDGPHISMASAYPFGALLQDTKTGGIYYVENGVKRPLWGKELISLYFKNRKVKRAAVDELGVFKTGSPIELSDGELVRTENSAAVYVISDGKRLPIVSGEAFEKQGWKWENVVTVSEKVLNISPLGEIFNPEEADFNSLAVKTS
jgi:hypothetical protein